MTKLEETNKWPAIVRMAAEGASLRQIAEEVDATPGAVNAALKRTDTPKAPAPPGPRARRGAAPPPVKAPKVPKVKAERQPRQKAPKAAKPKTFPEVLSGVFEEFGYPNHDMTTPEKAGDAIRSMFVSLGLTRLDNLSDTNTDDCDENAESDDVSSVSAGNDPDGGGEDDGGDCDGGANTDDVVPSVSASDDDDNITLSGTEEISDDDPRVSQTVFVDPNEVTLRGEIIDSPDDWGTPPSFSIPSDEELAEMNRDNLRKLAANPGLKGWAYLKGYSKMSADDLRANLAKVRNDSV